MKLLFNSSMPRAGSELLQVLLHQNPEIYGSPTSPLLEYQFAARNNFELNEVRAQPKELMEKAFLSMCKGMADSYYSSITDRPYVIDKSRGWLYYYEWVSEWCPEPKMVCMVRDLRSIMASMEKIYRANRFKPTGPDNPSQIQNITTEARVNYWLNTQPIGLALERLKDIFQKRLQYNILFLRYEDLLSKPQEVLNTWYSFAGIEPFQHDFNNITKKVAEDHTFFGPYGNHSIKNTLEPEHHWSETLLSWIGDDIVKSNPWYFKTFGY